MTHQQARPEHTPRPHEDRRHSPKRQGPRQERGHSLSSVACSERRRAGRSPPEGPTVNRLRRTRDDLGGGRRIGGSAGSTDGSRDGRADGAGPGDATRRGSVGRTIGTRLPSVAPGSKPRSVSSTPCTKRGTRRSHSEVAKLARVPRAETRTARMSKSSSTAMPAVFPKNARSR